MSDPLLKLYASILNFRLVTITEELGYRSPAQRAFRPGPVHLASFVWTAAFD